VPTVATTLTLAEQNHGAELKRVCLEFVSRNLQAVMETEGYQHMVSSCPQLQACHISASLFDRLHGHHSCVCPLMAFSFGLGEEKGGALNAALHVWRHFVFVCKCADTYVCAVRIRAHPRTSVCCSQDEELTSWVLGRPCLQGSSYWEVASAHACVSAFS
jgi:hypothetical protein